MTGRSNTVLKEKRMGQAGSGQALSGSALTNMGAAVKFWQHALREPSDPVLIRRSASRLDPSGGVKAVLDLLYPVLLVKKKGCLCLSIFARPSRTQPAKCCACNAVGHQNRKNKIKTVGKARHTA